MPGSEGQGTEFPFSSFLDDYFAECDEHLTAIRGGLLTLDASVDTPDPAGDTLEMLFRTFHTLKGLSSMVDRREAERLAHELESYLRAVRERQVPLTHRGVGLLMDGARLLEQVITARRDRHAIPDVGPIAARIARLAESVTPARPESAEEPVHASAAIPPEGTARPTWLIRYVPTPGLASGGVNVTTIRASLEADGRILQATPVVAGDGKIVFEFVVEADVDATVIDGWRRHGMSVEPREPVAAPPGSHATDEDAGRADIDTESPATPAVVAPSHFVRVDLTRLDDIMRIVGDLVIARARLAETLARVEGRLPAADWRLVQENTHGIERHLRDLREGVMRVRLVRIGEIFDRMVFVVRDLAREREKRVRLDVHGQTTEIDKFLIERMMDPVLHLVRNAIDHGLETAAARVAAGKGPEGVVALRASTSGESVLIEVEDDGRGIDAASVAERARAVGLPVPRDGVDSGALLDLLCAPGFSTREAADRVSGRGMGMAVVRRTIQELGGTLALDTEPGRGTCFTIQLPLTLAITDALIVVVGGRTFAVPQGAIREVIEVDASAIRRVENSEIVPYRDGVLPVVRLGRLFRLTEEARARLYAFVLGRGTAAVGVLVDRIVGQKEIVVRPFGDALLQIDGLTGATELGDGRMVLIVDTAALAQHAVRRFSPASAAARAARDERHEAVSGGALHG